MEYYWKNRQLEDLPNEVWKDIIGWEGLYRVSNLGRFKSLPRITRNRHGEYLTKEKIVIPGDRGSGYLFIRLTGIGHKSGSMLAHRIVATTHILNPDNKPQINHKNGIKSDNRVYNLEWCTCSENVLHSARILGGRHNSLKGKTGSLCIFSKTTYKYSLDKKILTIYGSACEAARENGLYQSYISLCCRGLKPDYGGFIWSYEKL